MIRIFFAASLLSAGMAHGASLPIVNADFEEANSFDPFVANGTSFFQLFIQDIVPPGWEVSGTNAVAQTALLAHSILALGSATPPIPPLEGLPAREIRTDFGGTQFGEFLYAYSTDLARLRRGSLSQTLSGQFFGDFDYSLNLQTHQRGDGAPLVTGASVSLFAGNLSNTVAEFSWLGGNVVNDFSFNIPASVVAPFAGSQIGVAVHSPGDQFLYFDDISLTAVTPPPNPVPLPASAALLLGGLIALGVVRLRRRTG